MAALWFPLQAEAVLETLTLDGLTTSEIEGELLNADQVRSSVARRLGVDTFGLVAADREVEGVVEMLLDATQQFAALPTDERLFGWHAALFPTGRSSMHRITVGGWRTLEAGSVQAVSGALGRERVHFQASDAPTLATDMRRFLDWFNSDTTLDVVLKAAVAHLWFITIHPFDDGNGRIARAVTAAETTLANVLRKAHYWKWLDTKPLDDRQRLLLNKLLDGLDGRLTTSKRAKIAKCSQDTALRDVQQLVEWGLFLKESAGGRSTNYALANSPPQ